jgi:hypothetical protein
MGLFTYKFEKPCFFKAAFWRWFIFAQLVYGKLIGGAKILVDSQEPVDHVAVQSRENIPSKRKVSSEILF